MISKQEYVHVLKFDLEHLLLRDLPEYTNEAKMLVEAHKIISNYMVEKTKEVYCGR